MTPSTEAPLQSASQNQLRGISSMLVTPAGAPAIATTPSTSGAAGPAVAAASVAAAPAAPRVTKQKLDAPRVARVSRVAGVSAASGRALRFEAGTRENDSPRHNRTAASAVAQTPSVAQTPVARSGNAATTTARNGAEGQAQGARWIHSFMAAHACRAKQSHASTSLSLSLSLSGLLASSLTQVVVDVRDNSQRPCICSSRSSVRSHAASMCSSTLPCATCSSTKSRPPRPCSRSCARSSRCTPARWTSTCSTVFLHLRQRESMRTSNDNTASNRHSASRH